MNQPSPIDAFFGKSLPAGGLPGRAYGQEFYAIEQRELFPKLWCQVGFVSELPLPGSVVPVELAGWPLLLLRDQQGDIKVFLNICRHRGMRLISEPCRVKDAISCPWHAWRYGLDGSLLATPRLGGENQHHAEGVKPQSLGLKEVRNATWHDSIFVNLDGQAPPFGEHIAPLNTLLAEFDLSDLHLGDTWSIDYPGNWKVAVEGAIEDYHLPIGHPELARGVRRWYPRLDFADQVYYSNSTRRELDDQHVLTNTPSRAVGLPEVPFHGEEPAPPNFFISVFPTGMLDIAPNFVVQGKVVPLGAEQTRFVFNIYYRGEAATDPAFAAQRQATLEAWQRIFEQDIPFVRDVHANYQLRDDAGIKMHFSPVWESNIPRFQQAVADVIRSPRAKGQSQGQGQGQGDNKAKS